MDVHSPPQRSYNMSKIKGKDTTPELTIRKWLWGHGYRYRLHRKDLPGKPDIVFASKRKVIFINGCFWHKHDCKYFKWPETNAEFWIKKINTTVLRDEKNYNKLAELHWNYLTVWECEIKKFDEKLKAKLIKFLDI